MICLKKMFLIPFSLTVFDSYYDTDTSVPLLLTCSCDAFQPLEHQKLQVSLECSTSIPVGLSRKCENISMSLLQKVIHPKTLQTGVQEFKETEISLIEL